MGDPEHDIYTSHVKMENICILFTISHHNGLKFLMGNVMNAYPHAKMKEKIYIIEGPEFGSQ